jgi:hypothetical protein
MSNELIRNLAILFLCGVAVAVFASTADGLLIGHKIAGGLLGMAGVYGWLTR